MNARKSALSSAADPATQVEGLDALRAKCAAELSELEAARHDAAFRVGVANGKVEESNEASRAAETRRLFPGEIEKMRAAQTAAVLERDNATRALGAIDKLLPRCRAKARLFGEDGAPAEMLTEIMRAQAAVDGAQEDVALIECRAAGAKDALEKVEHARGLHVLAAARGDASAAASLKQASRDRADAQDVAEATASAIGIAQRNLSEAAARFDACVSRGVLAIAARHGRARLVQAARMTKLIEDLFQSLDVFMAEGAVINDLLRRVGVGIEAAATKAMGELNALQSSDARNFVRLFAEKMPLEVWSPNSSELPARRAPSIEELCFGREAAAWDLIEASLTSKPESAPSADAA